MLNLPSRILQALQGQYSESKPHSAYSLPILATKAEAYDSPVEDFFSYSFTSDIDSMRRMNSLERDMFELESHHG